MLYSVTAVNFIYSNLYKSLFGILGGKEKFAYIGLFDGYNGKAASSLCREHLHEAILFEMSKLIDEMNSSDIEETLINRLYTRMVDPKNTNPRIKNIADVFRYSYLKMDHLLTRGIHETSSIRWSGTSAFTAVIVANDKIEDERRDNQPISFGQIHVANCGRIEMI
jgi:serine/threonine protein phosphatase PrpC